MRGRSVEKCEKTDEIPFDFERRRLSTVVRTNGACMIITKGAPEGVLAVCTSIEVGGECRPLGYSERKRCTETFRRSARMVCESSQSPIGRLIAPMAGSARMSVAWRSRDSSRSSIRRLRELGIQCRVAGGWRRNQDSHRRQRTGDEARLRACRNRLREDRAGH